MPFSGLRLRSRSLRSSRFSVLFYSSPPRFPIIRDQGDEGVCRDTMRSRISFNCNQMIIDVRDHPILLDCGPRSIPIPVLFSVVTRDSSRDRVDAERIVNEKDRNDDLNMEGARYITSRKYNETKSFMYRNILINHRWNRWDRIKNCESSFFSAFLSYLWIIATSDLRQKEEEFRCIVRGREEER